MQKQSNPLVILSTLDQFLRHPFTLIVYGRSALALGYPHPNPEFESTMDVDAILPDKDLAIIETNEDFWDAQEKTNDALSKSGLYFTHLFVDKQVILSPDWSEHTVPLTSFSFTHLKLERPSTHDLILTKMMRVDALDREDIKFLMRQADFDSMRFNECLQLAEVPDIPEIREAFESNKIWLSNYGSNSIECR